MQLIRKLNYTLLLHLVLVLLILQALPVAGETYTVNGHQIRTSLVPDKTTIMLGEPIYVPFIVQNQSDQDLQVLVGGDYRNRLGRPESFTVIVVGKDNKHVPQPNAGMSMGGMFGPQRIPAKGQYTFQLFLPNWAAFEETGSYTITAGRILKINNYVPNKMWSSKEKTTDIQSKASAKITVTPLNEAKMGELIGHLGKEILSDRYEDASFAIKKLENIQDERVVPYFLKALKSGRYNVKFHALNALSKFNNDSAFEGLKYGLEVSGEDFIRGSTTMATANSLAKNIIHTAIHAISESPHPKAIPFLLSRRDDEMDEIRLTVVHALGRMSADKATPILEEMKNDKNKTVRDEARRYLREFLSGKKQNAQQTNAAGAIAVLPFSIAMGDGPIEVDIVAPPFLLVGEHPHLEVDLRNTSGKTVNAVKPLDGSWYHWRYPRLSLQIQSGTGDPLDLKLGGRCGNMNPMRRQDIVSIQPGETVRCYLGWPFPQSGFTAPGEYNLRLVYDLASPDIQSWVPLGRASGGKRSQEINSLLGGIPSTCATSTLTRIEVKALSAANAAQVLIAHFKGNLPRVAFISNDYQAGKWKVTDVRHHLDHISVMVSFQPGYTPEELPVYTNANSRFKAGRYLLKREHTLRKAKRVTVLDFVLQHFDVIVPGKAKSHARYIVGQEAAETLGFTYEELPNKMPGPIP